MRLLLSIIFLATLGCRTIPSFDQETSDIEASLFVDTDDKRTKVTAWLRTGAADNLTLALSSGDVLIAHVASESRELTEDSSILGTFHQATFDPLEAATEVRVAFERENKTNAPESRVQIPEPPVILEPAPDSAFLPADTIEMVWRPVAVETELEWSIDSDCISHNEGRIDDSVESWQIPVNILDGWDATQACRVDLSLRLVVDGALDSAFAGGSIRAAQRRSVSVVLTP